MKPMPSQRTLSTGRLADLQKILKGRGSGAGRVQSEPLRRRAGSGPCALSFAQERLWFIDQLEPGSSLYTVPVQARLEEKPRVEVLRRTLVAIVRRHEVLRTRYESVAGRPVQVIDREPAGEILPLVDLGGLADARRGRELRRLAIEETDRPFDLSRGPVFRALLVRLDQEEHRLLANLHHIVCDAASTQVLLRELSSLYAAFSAGEASPLPELAVQYADYAAWQRARFESGGAAAELAYWRGALGEHPPVLELPTDRPRPAVQTWRGATRSVELSGELSASLGRLSRQSGATLFMTLLAVFVGLLRRYSAQPDLCVGTPISGRHRVELENLIGFFLNTLVIRVDSPGDPQFADLLALVRERSLAAFANRDLPFEKLVEELQPSRDLSHSPLFQVLFVLLHSAATPSFPGGLWHEPVAVRTSKFDLTVSVEAATSGMAVAVEYNTDLFDGATMARLLDHFGHLAAAVAVQSERRLSALPMLGEAERQSLLVESNDTSSSYACGGVHRLFEAQVERAPEATALVWEAETLSYGELDRRAGRLARRLVELGVGAESRVGLQLGRSADLSIGLLAILKAGGAYVPIDPLYPPQRRELMLADAQVSVLLTRESLACELSGGYSLLCLDRAPRGSALHGSWSPVEVADSNLAYVIYTSGSTGRPKGVSLAHGALRNLIEWHLATLLGGARTLQFASVSFDVSFCEMFACWGSGGTLYLISEEARRDVAMLGRYLVSRGLEKVILPVVVLQQLAEQFGRGGDLPPLLEVTTTGEQLQTTRAMGELCERLGACAFHNHYGPSESHVVTAYRLGREPGEWLTHPSIGVPIGNSSTYTLDGSLAPVPTGVAGELYLGGVCLARGYLGRPDLTAERFVPHPFSEPGGERLYRTGDKVRRLVDGTLDFLGRFDHQVKVRGFRVELEEVESVLGRHPEVLHTVVIAREMGVGDRRLIAYVVPSRAETDAAAWRRYLQERLPEYMVPSWFVVLESLPLTPNGKVDRRALPEPERMGGGADSGVGSVAPRTPAEEVVAAIWSEVLGLSRVGALDNFFELGGHSLLAVRVIARLRDAFGVELPLRKLFEAPTVALLAAHVEERRRGAAEPAAPALVPVARDRPLPLSFAQERLWFLDQLQPGSAQYNLPLALRLSGPLNPAALAWTLGRVERRHEALRTVFPAAEGAPVQVIRPAREPFPLPVVDLSGLAAGAREAHLARLAAAEALRPFDLAQGPLWRGSLLRLGVEDHGVLLTQHHIVSDGWSLAVLVREVVELYGAALEARPPRLADLPIQYADYASWQRDWLLLPAGSAGMAGVAGQGEALAAGLSYWRQRLAGAPPVLDLPGDRPRPAVRSWRGAARAVRLEEGLSQQLRVASVRQGATPFMTLLAGWMAALARWSGQEDLSVGTPVAGRPRIELEGLLGFFINTLVSRLDLAGIKTFRELVVQVREAWLSAYEHQAVPFEKLVEELAPQRSLSYTPLFQVMFVLQNAPRASARVGGLALSPVGLAGTSAKFDLTLSLEEQAGVFAGGLEYSTELFDAATMARFVDQLTRLLAGAVAAPDQDLRSLPLLSAAEEQQLAVEWSGAGSQATAAAGASVVERFESWAAKTPDAVAVLAPGEALSYAHLDARANRLARRLRSLGVTVEDLVGVCAERSPAMIVAVFGILKAGAAYVPLDPTYPRQRLAYMVEDARLAVLVTEERLRGRLPETPETAARLLLLDSEGAEGRGLESESAERLPAIATPGSLAYVIYTSGSTGRPKGVMIHHHGWSNLAEAQRRRFGVGPGTRVLQFASLSFDASAWDISMALCAGAMLLLGPRERRLAAEELTLLLRQCDLATLPPAVLPTLTADESPELSTLIVGGEACPLHVARTWVAGRRFFNAYGPTEATITATVALYDGGDRLPIGRPIDGVEAWVLDARGNPAPIGVVGELCLAGAGLARGYLNRPEQTARSFVPHPFSALPGERLYRTGDLAFRRPEGSLEILGRLDHQVKIRGFRVELGEIEAVLAAVPGVREAAVVARASGASGLQLVAYVVGDVTGDVLRRALRERLPEHMVPSWFVVLESLPLTPNGKLDRRALPEPERIGGGADSGVGSVAPRTPAEEVVAAIWSEVLGVSRVAAEDNFFELGGHSLLAVRVIARLRAAFGVELPLRELFAAPTVALLAAQVEERRRGAAEPVAPALAPVARDRPLPLSFAQERLWFLDQLQPGSAQYNLPLALRVSGPLNPAALAWTLGRVERRHEALRTVFPAVEGAPAQMIRPPREPFPLPVVDLSGLAEGAREVHLGRLAAAEALRPFDLAQGPLWRGSLLRLGEQDHGVLLTQHHIVSDGWSLAVLVREAVELYGAVLEARPPRLADLPIQYADYASWQRGWLKGEALAAGLSYWRERLAGAPPVLDLPGDRPRPAVRSWRGAARAVRLEEGLSRQLRAASVRQGATPFMTLLAGWMAALARWSGQEDLSVGTPVAGRPRIELEGLLGFFINTLVSRLDLSGIKTFRELVVQVREAWLSAYEHQAVPFEKLVEELAPQRSLSYTPLFQVMFVLQNAPRASARVGGLALSPVGLAGTSAKFDLTLALEEQAGVFAGGLEYSTELFDAATMARFVDQLTRLLAGAVAAPDQDLRSLPLLSAAEEHQLVVEWSGTGRQAAAAAGASVVERFESWAAKTPDAVAVLAPGEALSYAHLDARANRLARRLRSLGVTVEDLVGVCAERSPAMIVAVFGILKAGAAYVPLDPTYPRQRLAYMVEDARLAVLVTEERLRGRLPETPETAARLLLLDSEGADERGFDCKSAEGLPGIATPGSLAYVIYTSGSTGRPKGAMIHHHGWSNLAEAQRRRFGVGPADRVLQFASLSFDASAWEISMALCAGATLLLGPRERRLSAEELTLLLRHCDLAVLPPAVLPTLTAEESPELSTLIVGGEACPLHVARTWAAGRRFFNAYGPTEATVCATVALYDGGDRLPIGRPIDGVQAWVLDARGNPAPIGVVGELCLGGAGLARGYLNRPEQTARSFVPHPFPMHAGERLYRTGDLAFRRPEGSLEILGRLDHQVKIRGFRVELGEIEAVLAAVPGVREAAVVARASGASGLQLVAYAVSDVTGDVLRRALRERLPEHMVPSWFVALDALPLTPNGKLDRHALPAPELGGGAGSSVGYVAPRTPAEELVAAIWSDVLGVSRVGALDNFFELGGHSLLAVQAIARLRSIFPVDLPLRVLFEHPTVGGTAQTVAEALGGEDVANDVARLYQQLQALSDKEVQESLSR